MGERRWQWVRGGLVVLGLGSSAAQAVGVSPYLPLNMEPEVERQIERVLILGDQPILQRPIAAATVVRALPQACLIDQELCERVRGYLQRYMGNSGITLASAEVADSHGPANDVLPNAHGLTTRDHYEFEAEGYVQPSDYLLVNGGGIAYSHRAVPTGTVVSVGLDAAQLDIGWRDHWMSPMTDSSMLPGTEAPTMPGVTLSNFRPLTGLGLEYELFVVRMSKQPITYNGPIREGRPNLAGIHLSIEPVPGWSFGVNRVIEYGGGNGLPSSASFLLTDLVKPSGNNQNRSNTQASYVSRFTLPTRTPLAIYVEYGGENTSNGGSYLLGEAALSAGIDFPKLWGHFDATIEASEWQDTWYTHFDYLYGMTYDQIVLGNWGAQQRRFNDGVGARSAMARIGWEFPNGGYLEEKVHLLANEPYYAEGESRTYVGIPGIPYRHYYDAKITYSQPLSSLTVGGGLFFGRDVFGGKFTRLDGFVRFSPSAHHGYADFDTDDRAPKQSLIPGAEVFVDAGVNGASVKTNLEPNLPTTTSKWQAGPHVAIGARRAVSANNDMGARLELDYVAGHTLIGVRMLDWRYRFGKTVAVSAFAGPADWEQRTPALSLYGGLGLQLRNLRPGWDLGADFRYGQNLARDHQLATDIQGVRAETFYKVESLTLSLSRHF